MDLLQTSTGRKVLFASLYLSEGAPIGFIWWALPTKLRMEGYPIDEITKFTSILVLPWVFKFLWSPLVDTIQSQRWTLRSWILLMQFMMGLTLLPLFFFNFVDDFSLLAPFLFVHAIAAATQDASIDALAISAVPADERGSVNGWMQVGMISGRSLLGGGALLLENMFGQQVVFVALIMVIWFSSVLLLRTKPTATLITPERKIEERLKHFSAQLRRVSRSRSTWLGLLFAGIGGAAFEAVGAVAGPFMIDRGIPSHDVGLFFAVPSVLGLLAGALVGGFLSDKLGRRQSVALFLILLVSVVYALSGVDVLFGESGGNWIVILLAILYICIGLFTAASYALFMDITDPRIGATQFSAFMGATNGCESWSSFAVGRLISGYNYAGAFLIMGAISLASLPILKALKNGAGRRST